MPQNTKVELTRELIKALLNESRQNAITPAQLAAIYKRIIDIVDEDAAERQQAVTDAQNAASSAAETLRQITEFASSRLVCNFGNIHISPALSGIELSQDPDREKVTEAKSVIAAGGSIAGTITSTNAKGNDIRLNISTYSLYSPSAGDNRIQIEAVASDCTASNLRFYMMRVNFLFREGGKILYDSTPLRQIDIPVTADFTFDPVTFSRTFNRITEKDLPELSRFKAASNKYVDIDIDSEKFTEAGNAHKIYLDRAFDIEEMSCVIDNMDAIGCNEFVAPVFLHSGDTVIGRFPAFFSRFRDDEESYWQVTGYALLEYAGSVWSLAIAAMPEDNRSEILLTDTHAAGSGSGTQTRTLNITLGDGFPEPDGFQVNTAYTDAHADDNAIDAIGKAIYASDAKMGVFNIALYKSGDFLCSMFPATAWCPDGVNFMASGIFTDTQNIFYISISKSIGKETAFVEILCVSSITSLYDLADRIGALEKNTDKPKTTRALPSPPFLQRGIIPLGAKPGVYYRNNGYIKLPFPGKINLLPEDFTASWDLSKIDPEIFPGITGRVHVPPARADIDNLPLQPGDLVVDTASELVHSVIYDTEKKTLTASFTRSPYGTFVQSFRLCVANPKEYNGADIPLIVKHADGTIRAVNGISAYGPSLPAPELKIGKLKDITTIEELILTAREQAGWIHGYELQRKTRIKRELADGSIHKTKWVRQKKLRGHRIGVFRIRFRTKRGDTGPWTVFSFCHKAGNKFRIL